MKPKISVCIPTYNGGKYIHEQLASILIQLPADSEVIISDDSSSDNTLDIVRGFNDDRIKVIPGNSFKSPTFNLENALNNVTGDHIFLADQDDIWEKDKVTVMSGLLDEYDLVLSDCSLINETGAVISGSFFRLNRSKKGFINNLIKNSYIGCCMAFNGKILKRALPFPKNIPMHDAWIGLIGELFGRTVFCDKKLIKYRRHDNNLSPTSGKSPYPMLKKISFRINLFLNLFRRVLRLMAGGD